MSLHRSDRPDRSERRAPASAHRRQWLGAGLALALSSLGAASRAATPGPLVEVWKSPTCGCCTDWIDHLEANGFRTKVYETGNTAIRTRLGIDLRYGSCHTARVDGYALEGHVPASDVKRLLKEKPKAIGLAVPGMPVGSPGMDGPVYAGRKDPYDVLLLAADGSATVFQAYR